MQNAAANEGAGAAMAFMGMNMAGAAGGMNANNLYQMGRQAEGEGWKCSCGATVNGNFCPQCGAKKPGPQPAADTLVGIPAARGLAALRMDR